MERYKKIFTEAFSVSASRIDDFFDKSRQTSMKKGILKAKSIDKISSDLMMALEGAGDSIEIDDVRDWLELNKPEIKQKDLDNILKSVERSLNK